jgi:hypothetical protein
MFRNLPLCEYEEANVRFSPNNGRFPAANNIIVMLIWRETACLADVANPGCWGIQRFAALSLVRET